MREMGGVHATIRQVQTMPENEILQQRMPKECMGIPQALVRCSHTIALVMEDQTSRGDANPKASTAAALR
jgi:hypothetical protein